MEYTIDNTLILLESYVFSKNKIKNGDEFMNNFLYRNTQHIFLEEDIELIKVLAHPTRLQIVNELTNNPTLNVTQLTEILKIPQSTTSQHLSKLRRNVLRAERKGLEMYYYVENTKATKIMEILKFPNKN